MQKAGTQGVHQIRQRYQNQQTDASSEAGNCQITTLTKQTRLTLGKVQMPSQDELVQGEGDTQHILYMRGGNERQV